MVSPFYSMFNVFYQIGTLIFLWLLNKDLNNSFIPPSLIVDTKDPKASFLRVLGYAGCKIILLLVEAAILILVISAINQIYLRATESAKKRKLIAGETIKVNVILTFIYIIILTWGHFLA